MKPYRFLCQCLDSFASLHETLEDREWETFVRFARQEFVEGAVYAALRRKDELDRLPPPIRQKLKHMYHLNSVRHERLKGRLTEAIRLLNDRGIEPMILKGGLRILDPRVDPGSAFMWDIDMVVPMAALDESVGALVGAGYRPQGEGKEWTYHYRPLIHPSRVSVELHVRVGEQRDFLTPDEAWAEAEAIPLDGSRALRLGATHRLLHNVFHSEVMDRGYFLGFFGLRRLLVFVELCRDHAETIDWTAAADRMERHHLAHILRNRFHQAQKLLGLPTPDGFEPDRRARLHFRRCMLSIRWGRFHSAAGHFDRLLLPFDRHRIDLMYDCGGDSVRIAMSRARHGLRLFRRYRWNAWREIAHGGGRG
ncbi:MAG TPA: nucleotidyltransferase family protein [Gemmatimonadota bacterium]|nr:nucleotidyltransferase family protein [Gemmatimonadota bacterium]